MSLITIDDDSSEDLAIISEAGDNDVATKKSSKEMSVNKSHTQDSSSDNDSDEDLNGESSNSVSNDTDLVLPLQVEETDDSVATVLDLAGQNDETKEKPILELMKHLIHYNGKQNTTLTNSELIKMLKNEFQVDVDNLPSIYVEIYMNVLKKFLKEWPQWDEFDRVMHESRCMNDNEEIERMLEQKYSALRQYLGAMLIACRPFARESAQKIRSAEIPLSVRADLGNQIPSGDGDVTLEVNCTRSQLNTLFFRKPNPNFNNTIFNVENTLPSKINLSAPSLKEILNGCHVRISINTKCFRYKRELIHDLKHKLVNKKNQQQSQGNKLSVYLQTPKALPKKDKSLTMKDIKVIINKIILLSSNLRPIQTIFQIINDDISVIEGEVGTPAVFRHYMNPYAYVRYLREDVDTESDTYDLQLEETLSPRLKFQLTKVSYDFTGEIFTPKWLKLECLFCEVTFFDVSGVEQLKEHFRDYHQDEPDLTCTNCDKKFSVNQLALKRWYHKCVVPVIFNSDSE